MREKVSRFAISALVISQNIFEQFNGGFLYFPSNIYMVIYRVVLFFADSVWAGRVNHAPPRARKFFNLKTIC